MRRRIELDGTYKTRKIFVAKLSLVIIMDGGRGPFRTLQGKQGNSTIYHTPDGFLYFCYKSTDSAMYYRCTKYKQGCPMRAVYNRWTTECQFSGQHTHPTDEGELQYRTARNSLLNEAKRLDIVNVQEIFDDPRYAICSS